MEEMVREYDNIYNGFLDSLSELVKARQDRNDNPNEDSLLERITMLEKQRDSKRAKFEQVEEERDQLKKRVNEMEKLKKEIENVGQKVEENNFKRTESLNRELKRLKQELRLATGEKKHIEQENQRLVETLAKSEINFTQTEKELRDEREKLNAKQKGLEDLVSEYQLKVKQVESELLERRNELNKLKSKGNSYHKNYNMMSQLYKTNEAKVRSMESEIRKLKGDLTKRKVEAGRAKEAMETLAGELRRKGLKKRGLTELLGSICELIDLEEVYDEHLSIDTEEEMRWEVDKNLKDAHEEFDEKSILGKEDEFEEQLQAFNTLDSDVFANKEYNEGNQVPDYAWFQDSAQPPAEDDIFKRNRDSDLTETRSRKLSEIKDADKSREEYRSQLEEQIEGNVLKRMRPSRSFHERRPKESPAKEGQSEDTVGGTRGRSSIGLSGRSELTEVQKSRIYGKCRELDSELFEVVEKEQIEMRVKMFRKVDDFVLWLMEYLEEKLRKVRGEFKALLSEKRTRNNRDRGAHSGQEAGGNRQLAAALPRAQRAVRAPAQPKHHGQQPHSPQEKPENHQNPRKRTRKVQEALELLPEELGNPARGHKRHQIPNQVQVEGA